MKNQILYLKILKLLHVTEEEMISSCRRPDLADARCLTAAALMKQRFMRQDDVAEFFKTTQGAVSKMLARHKKLLEVDTPYRNKWESILDLFK